MVLSAPLASIARRTALVLLLAGTALFGVARARAEEKEVRDFITFIGDKRAGTYRMTITPNSDGSVTMEGSATISLSYLIRTYKYKYDGTEVWKDGQLTSLKSVTNDDGKKYNVSAVPDREGLRVNVNGRERLTKPDVWVTTYWRLPDAKFRGQQIALLDADTGRDLNGTLQDLGLSPLTIAGQQQSFKHFRVTGDVSVDFWYDGSDRLVRQEWVEDGHRVVLQLTGISR